MRMNVRQKNNCKTKSGYIAILAVLVLLSVTGGLAAALTALSIGSNQSAEALRQGDRALFFSESCAEEVLLQIVRNPDYSGGNFQLPEGECETVVEKNESTYIIQAAGSSDDYKRRLAVEASLEASKIVATSWREE
jgi:hypothetical protein